MRKFKIFVSGVQKELKEERRVIKNYILGDVLLSEYFEVFLFEDAPAKSRSSEAAYLDEVRRSDIYIGILGNQYGGTKKSMISPTEVEFIEARNKHKNILVYIKGANSSNDKKREEGVQKLIKQVQDPQKGYSYKRFNNAAELVSLVYASLIDFLKEKGIVGRGAFDERVCAKALFDDIDEDKVRWFLHTAKNTRKFPLGPNASVEDVLMHLNLIRDRKPTNAAILLFGKKPNRFLLQAEIKCVQLPGTEIRKPFSSYKIYDDNLFEQVDKAVAFVLDAIRQPVIQQKSTPQFKRPLEIPVFAIQEAIINAVAHRNYNVSSAVQVMVFIDRVEVWNSGSLPPELSIDDLSKPHTSFPANPLIAHVLYLADYMQKTGSGTLEMIAQCRNKGLPDPEFVLIRNAEFRAIIRRDIYTEDALNKLGLNERQIVAVQYARSHGVISLSALRKLFSDCSEKTLYRDLQYLVKRGVFKAKGEKKGRKYLLR